MLTQAWHRRQIDVDPITRWRQLQFGIDRSVAQAVQDARRGMDLL